MIGSLLNRQNYLQIYIIPSALTYYAYYYNRLYIKNTCVLCNDISVYKSTIIIILYKYLVSHTIGIADPITTRSAISLSRQIVEIIGYRMEYFNNSRLSWYKYSEKTIISQLSYLTVSPPTRVPRFTGSTIYHHIHNH